MDYIQQCFDFATDGVPSYTTAYHDMRWGFDYCIENCTESDNFTPSNFFNDLTRFGQIDRKELTAIAGLTVLWTLLRYLMGYVIFSPIASYFKLTPVNATKFPESAWKFLFYTTLWVYTTYVIFGVEENSHIFFDPDSIWADYKPGMTISPLIYYLYMLQLSFYFHSIYGTCCMDAWRKDSAMMLFHHVLTISLIGFSFVCRYHKIGVLVIWLHDVTDIALESTKCNVYFKNRGGQFYKFHDMYATVGFIVFSICWYVFRLYWLPLKVLHSTGYGSMYHHQTHKLVPFYFFFNGMLWALQLLNIWWFMFIINFLVKVATGQITEVDDIREEEVIREKLRKQKEQEMKALRQKQNGRSPRGRSKKAD